MKQLNSVLAGVGLATLASAASAQSSVQITGVVDEYAGVVHMAGGSRTAVLNNGGLTTSQLAFKGSEDLGGGLKAGFTLAAYIQADNGTIGRFTGDTFFSQASNVSLSGNFGSVFLGRGQAPNYLPSILFNPFGDSFSFSPLLLQTQVPLYGSKGAYWNATVPADAGWNNRILYITPSFAGLTTALFYQFGEIANASGKSNFGVNFMYENGPLAATAYYEKTELTNPGTSVLFTTGDQKTDWMVGGTWDFKVTKAFATYGTSSSNILVPEARTASLGASTPVGAGKVLAETARTSISAGGATRLTTTLGYDYFLSKRTDVYANVMHDAITGLSGGTSFAVGLRHRF